MATQGVRAQHIGAAFSDITFKGTFEDEDEEELELVFGSDGFMENSRWNTERLLLLQISLDGQYGRGSHLRPTLSQSLQTSTLIGSNSVHSISQIDNTSPQMPHSLEADELAAALRASEDEYAAIRSKMEEQELTSIGAEARPASSEVSAKYAFLFNAKLPSLDLIHLPSDVLIYLAEVIMVQPRSPILHLWCLQSMASILRRRKLDLAVSSPTTFLSRYDRAEFDPNNITVPVDIPWDILCASFATMEQSNDSEIRNARSRFLSALSWFGYELKHATHVSIPHDRVLKLLDSYVNRYEVINAQEDDKFPAIIVLLDFITAWAKTARESEDYIIPIVDNLERLIQQASNLAPRFGVDQQYLEAHAFKALTSCFLVPRKRPYAHVESSPEQQESIPVQSNGKWLLSRREPALNLALQRFTFDASVWTSPASSFRAHWILRFIEEVSHATSTEFVLRRNALVQKWYGKSDFVSFLVPHSFGTQDRRLNAAAIKAFLTLSNTNINGEHIQTQGSWLPDGAFLALLAHHKLALTFPTWLPFKQHLSADLLISWIMKNPPPNHWALTGDTNRQSLKAGLRTVPSLAALHQLLRDRLHPVALASVISLLHIFELEWDAIQHDKTHPEGSRQMAVIAGLFSVPPKSFDHLLSHITPCDMSISEPDKSFRLSLLELIVNMKHWTSLSFADCLSAIEQSHPFPRETSLLAILHLADNFYCKKTPPDCYAAVHKWRRSIPCTHGPFNDLVHSLNIPIPLYILSRTATFKQPSIEDICIAFEKFTESTFSLFPLLRLPHFSCETIPK